MSELATAPAIGVDIGGTKIAAAVVDPDGRIRAERRAATPAAGTPDEIHEVVAQLVAELLVEAPDAGAVGVGAAGYVDAAGDVVLSATHLSWRDEPMRARVERLVGRPVHVENDGSAAAWAEYRFGAGRDTTLMLLATVGTGVGGGIVADGRLLRGWTGVGAEIGHTVLEREGRPCGCGRRGCLEQYASGTALVREARQLARDHAGVSHTMLRLAGGSPDRVEGPMVTEAAEAGDLGAVRAFERVGTALGRGLASLVNVLDPERVVVGGGVAAAGEVLLGPARAEMVRYVVGADARAVPELVAATTGNRAGVIGAADLARRRFGGAR